MISFAEMDWLQIGQSFGVPVLLLVFIGLGLWRAGMWMATTVIKPIMERHLRFLDTLERTIVGQENILDDLAKNQERLTEDIHAIVLHLNLPPPSGTRLGRKSNP